MTKIFTAIVTALVSVICLIIMVFILAGSQYFLDTLARSVLHIAVVSVTAGVLRLFFKRESLGLSVICGVGVSITGFLIILAKVVSRI